MKKSTGKKLVTILLTATMALTTSSMAFADDKVNIVIMPKLIGIDYYNAVEEGVNQAKEELKDVADISWTGPTEGTADAQIEMLSSIIATQPDVIAVACDDTEALVPTFQQARDAGIKVVTWDSDSASDRDLFVDLVDYDVFGTALIDDMAEQIGNKGKIALITTSFTATNQVNWTKVIENKIESDYPDIEIITKEAVGEDTQAAYEKATALMNSNDDLAGFIVMGCPNVPGVAQAVEEAGKSGKVAVVGNGLPNSVKQYLKSGTMKQTEIWNATYHGYLTLYSAVQLVNDGLKEGDTITAGDLGDFEVKAMDDGTLTIAMDKLTVTADNVDDYDF
jgi:rhamnose transport system substrate-binding protein